VLPEPKLNAIVALRNEISPWLMILRVVSDGWTLPDFRAGQFAVIGLPGSRQPLRDGPARSNHEPDRVIRRPILIASSSLISSAGVLCRTDYSGLAPLFSRISDRIWLTEDHGAVHRPLPQSRTWMIATGTGLHPQALSTHLMCGGASVAVLRRRALVGSWLSLRG
jgi:hypothetical protein